MSVAKKRPAAASTTTQRGRIIIALRKLAPDVTSIDRKACMKQFKITMVTVGTYLKGEVLNNDLGIEMIEFYRRRIEIREHKLNMLCPPSSKRK